MSFTTTIKDEISKFECSKYEQIAELSGFIRNNGQCNKKSIILITENNSIARRIYSLIKELYQPIISIVSKENLTFKKSTIHTIKINDKVMLILKSLSIYDENNKYLSRPGNYIVDSIEEKRAYLRGVFMATGSINNPKTARYHLELSITLKDEAVFIQKIMNDFDLNAKIFNRDNKYMIYLKEAEKISDFLRIINAINGLLYYEDIRIYRDHKNMTNRLNNCEQANVNKIVETATNQLKDIQILLDNGGINLLDDKTKEVITYRLKYKESSLQELSEIISLETSKKITKSGLNHRFRKIKELANKMKTI